MMKTPLFSLIVICALLVSKWSSAQPVSFEKEYGHPSRKEYAVQMIPCCEGGFLALGKWGGMGSHALLIRTDDDGVVLWQKDLNDTSFFSLNPTRILQARDSGFYLLVSPHTVSPGPAYGALQITKLDKLGQLQWNTCISNQYDANNAVDFTESKNGDLYVCANYIPHCDGCPSEGSILKFNANGHFLWEKRISTYFSYTQKISMLSDSTLLCAVNNYGICNLLELDTAGTVITARCFYTPSGTSLLPADWAVDSTGHLKAVLFFANASGIVLCKFDANGNLSGSLQANFPYSLTPVQLLAVDTHYLALMKSGGPEKIVITDWSDGSVRPNAIQGGSAGAVTPCSFVRKPDGSIYIFGSLPYPTTATTSDLHLLKTGIATTGILPAMGCSIDTLTLAITPIFIIDSLKTLTFLPLAMNVHPSYLTDSTAQMTASTVCLLTGMSEQSLQGNGVSVFPNPTKELLTIQLPRGETNVAFELYDLTGKLLFSQQLDQPENTIVVHEAPGCYLYRLRSRNLQEQGKLVLVE